MGRYIGKGGIRHAIRDLLDQGYDKAAHYLMRKYCVGDEAFVDEVIEKYLAGSKNWLVDVGMIGRAKSLVPLGASMAMRERVLAELIRIGSYAAAQEMAATHLHRKLTVDEARSLVVAYVGGAVTSRSQEEDLMALTHAIGGDDLRAWAQLEIERYHERGRFD